MSEKTILSQAASKSSRWMLCSVILSTSQTNRVNKVLKVAKSTSDKCHFNPKKTRQTSDVLVSIATAIEKDWRITVCELVDKYDLSLETIYVIFTEQSGPVAVNSQKKE
jgi:hypothetical protein